MTKILLAVILLVGLISISEVMGETSKTTAPNKSYSEVFGFSLAVLQSLHQYYIFFETEQDVSSDNLDNVGLMTFFLEQNQHMVTAQTFIKPYISQGNSLINTIANILWDAYERLKQLNINAVNALKDGANGKVGKQGDTDYIVAKMISDKKEAGRKIFIAVGNMVSLYVDFNVPDNQRKGPLQYLISKEERKAILDQINQLFADPLNKYENYLLAKEQRKPFNPEPATITWTAMAVEHLKKELKWDTYEEYFEHEKR